MTTQSHLEPIFTKNIALDQNQEQEYYSFSQNKTKAPKELSDMTAASRTLRTVQLNLTTKLHQTEHSYTILVYIKNNGGKCNDRKSRVEKKLLAHFEFRLRRHDRREVGGFENKGYLIDQSGYRLGISLLEINYNDIFSRDEVGRHKFEHLLHIF